MVILNKENNFYEDNQMKENKKVFLGITLISIFLISLIYITSISSLPDNIIMFQGEKLNFNTLLGINIQTKDKEINTNNQNKTKC